MTLDQSQTLFIPISSPPTPSPSPGPSPTTPQSCSPEIAALPQTTPERRNFLTAVLQSCTHAELLFIANSLAPLLKRDFLSALPPELGLHILGFLDDPGSLVRTSAVSRSWRAVATAETLWKAMCADWGFGSRGMNGRPRMKRNDEDPLGEMDPFADLQMDAALEWRRARRTVSQQTEDVPPLSQTFSYRSFFKESYVKVLNWERGGRLLRSHRLPMISASAQLPLPSSTLYPTASPNLHAPGPPLPSPSQAQQEDGGVVTSLALDSDWVVVGLASSRIHIFSARTGVLARTLVGHNTGVWGLSLISASPHADAGRARDGRRDSPPYGDDVPVSFRDLNLGEGSGRRTTRRTDVGSDEDDSGLDQSLSPGLRMAVGLHSDSLGSAQDEDERGGVGGRGVVDEDAEESNGYRHERNVHADSSDRYGNSGPPTTSIPRSYAPERQSDPSFASDGWGQPNALVVSGGCDKIVRVWDVKSGHCIYALPGHTSTIRCIRTLHGRPLVVTGSRDATVRTWDVQRGRAIHVLVGHTGSVRTLDVNGNRAASGSYDTTCRIWDLDTGECLHVLRGHYHQVYTVAFDGVLVATGGLDTTVRVWDAETGQCLALLQGHTSLVCQLQLSRKHQLLATGGSDGRVITFSLASSEDAFFQAASERTAARKDVRRQSARHWKRRFEARPFKMPSLHNTISPPPPPYPPPRPSASNGIILSPPQRRAAYEPLHRIAAHDSSVTALQFDGRFLLTSGNDGRVRLWETQTGRFVREMTEPGDLFWKVGFAARQSACGRGEEEEEEVGGTGEPVSDVCVVVGKRNGKTVLEVWGFGEE